jgi:hypothetical protein
MRIVILSLLFLVGPIASAKQVIANYFECPTDKYTITASLREPKFTMTFKNGAIVQAAHDVGNLTVDTFVGKFIGFRRGIETDAIALLVPKVTLLDEYRTESVKTLTVETAQSEMYGAAQETFPTSTPVICTASYKL